jgi:hypothetical protein
LAFLDFLDEFRGKDIDVDFQADSECCLRANTGPYSARVRSLYRPMKLEGIAQKASSPCSGLLVEPFSADLTMFILDLTRAAKIHDTDGNSCQHRDCLHSSVDLPPKTCGLCYPSRFRHGSADRLFC